MFKSFKKFIEENHPFISSLEDELGINVNDLKNEPQIGSFFSIGKGSITNLGPYKIIQFKKNESGKITHAIVQQNNEFNKKYKDKDGKIIQLARENNKKFIVPIEDLDKLMSQDFQPPAPTEGTPGGIV